MRGRHWRDQVVYTRRQLEEALPCVWDPEHIFSLADGARQGGAGSASRMRPRSTSPDWILAAADAQLAYARANLLPQEREVLKSIYHFNLTLDNQAALWDVDPDDVEELLESGVLKTLDYLNGKAR